MMLTKEVRESNIEIQANVALTGHDLRPFEQVEVVTYRYEAGVGIAINFPGLGIRGF